MATPRLLSSRTRLETLFARHEPDRTPILGGWIACPEYICTIAQATIDEYWADPVGVSTRAYQLLGMDGLIGVFVPRSPKDYRCVDANSYVRAKPDLSLEDAIARVEAMPAPEKIESDLDFEAAYASFRKGLIEGQARCGDMLWMPAQWGAGARVTWYGDLGYENYFMIVDDEIGRVHLPELWRTCKRHRLVVRSHRTGHPSHGNASTPVPHQPSRPRMARVCR
ncbi:MAG: hypothetical protein HYU36_23185 [Planctomycetes bacterium]|nr:hypothetical protein [Planctomycetota bacterium]